MSDKLGSGTFGTVVRDGDYALKYLRNPFDGLKEYAWCYNLNHPNLIRHHDIEVKNVKQSELPKNLRKWFNKGEPSEVITHTESTIATIKMDLCDTNLRTLVNDEKLTSDQYDYIIRKIMEVIHYLHTNLIVHSDLKPDNILINYRRTHSGIEIKKVIICDLGITNIQKYAEVHNTAPMYQYVDYKPNIDHDIYSLGAVITRIFNPHLKMEKRDNEKTPKDLKHGRKLREFREVRFRRYLNEGNRNIPSRYRDLVRRMLSPERPTITECMRELGYQVPQITPIYEHIYIFDYYHKRIDMDFYEIGRDTGLRRARMGSYAIREYLHRQGLLKNKVDNSYLKATAIILQALYGSKRYAIKDITPWCPVVKELLNDRKFVLNITTPSPYVHEHKTYSSRTSSGCRRR